MKYLFVLVFFLFGCESEPTLTEEKRVFTSGQIAGCPDHPFKPEFQDLKKAGLGQAIKLDIKIYAYNGVLIQHLIYESTSNQGGVPPIQAIWNFKDANGADVKSGYYFWAVTDLADNSEIVKCTFYVNPADNGKML